MSFQFDSGGGGAAATFAFTGVLASIPGTCTVGQLAFITNATAGQNIYECAATNTWTQQLNSGAGGASVALDNLVAPNINASLLFQSAKDVGSAAKPAREVFLYGAGTYGTTSLKLTGTPTGARIWTLQDTTDTVVGLATTDTLTNKTLTTPTVASFTNATHNHSNAAGGGTLALGTAITNLSGAVVTSGSSVTTPGAIDALNSSQFCSAAGANTTTYTCNLSPAISSYVTGTHYRFKADVANTAASTINFNSLGAKTIKKAAGGVTTDIVASDLQAGQWVDLIYDGTNMQMQSTLGNAGGGGASYPLTITGTNATSTNNVITATDTASNTGTGYAFNGTTASSSALNGLKLNRGTSGTGSRALSVQDATVEKAWVDFSGNASFTSMAFASLVLNGATSGTTTLQATAIAGSTTLTLPAATDTLVALATTDTLTNKTLTTPKITTINDANGNPFMLSTATASAVDSITVTNAATANPANVQIGTSGTDSNINLNLNAKGTAAINLKINGTTKVAVNSSGQLDVAGQVITSTGGTLTVQGGAAGHVILSTGGGSGNALFEPQGHIEADDTNQVTAPTIAGGTCGTSPSIQAGSTDNAMEINVGTGGVATTCQVNFGKTFAKHTITHPICTANSETDIFAFKVTYATGASVTITSTTAFTASSKISVLCF